jgi:hypothetical protein
MRALMAVGIAFFLALFVVGTVRGRFREWLEGPPDKDLIPPPYWPFGYRAWISFMASAPTLIALAVLVYVPLIGLLSFTGSSELRTLKGVFALAATIGFVIVNIVGATRWPAFLVPARLRHSDHDPPDPRIPR